MKKEIPVKYLLTNQSDINIPKAKRGVGFMSSKSGCLVGLDDTRFIMKQRADSTDFFALETNSPLDPDIFNRAIGSYVNITLNETSDKIKVESFEYGPSPAFIHRVFAIEQQMAQG